MVFFPLQNDFFLFTVFKTTILSTYNMREVYLYVCISIHTAMYKICLHAWSRVVESGIIASRRSGTENKMLAVYPTSQIIAGFRGVWKLQVLFRGTEISWMYFTGGSELSSLTHVVLFQLKGLLLDIFNWGLKKRGLPCQWWPREGLRSFCVCCFSKG